MGEHRERATWFGQSIRMQIAAIASHELLNARGRHLRDQVIHFLVVRSGMQRFHDVPVIVLLLQLHFAGGRPEHGPDYLVPTLNEPRWLLFVEPLETKTWQGVGWAKKYKHYEW